MPHKDTKDPIVDYCVAEGRQTKNMNTIEASIMTHL